MLPRAVARLYGYRCNFDEVNTSSRLHAEPCSGHLGGKPQIVLLPRATTCNCGAPWCWVCRVEPRGDESLRVLFTNHFRMYRCDVSTPALSMRVVHPLAHFRLSGLMICAIFAVI